MSEKEDWICPLCKKKVPSKIEIKRVMRGNVDLNYIFDLPIGTWCCIDCWDMQMKRNVNKKPYS